MPEKPVDQALRLLTYGMYVVTTTSDGEEAAALTEWLSQVSLHPPVLAVSVPEGSAVFQILSEGAPFVVNILKAGQKTLAEAFADAAASQDPLREHATERAANGCLYLPDALAFLECNPGLSVDLSRGALLFTGEVASATILSEGQPLTLRQTGLDPLSRRK